MSEVKFYRCRHCGNLVAVVEDAGPVPVCCGEPMELLVAGAKDAAAEKHVPDVTREGNVLRVRVGSVEHPMLPEHHIQWIAACSLPTSPLARPPRPPSTSPPASPSPSTSTATSTASGRPKPSNTFLFRRKRPLSRSHVTLLVRGLG